jgi:signal transduction histidine kinase/DNA-binding response OmpR family regulator/HPt (histidine-containing phosphotransfer) domain-containing protein
VLSKFLKHSPFLLLITLNIVLGVSVPASAQTEAKAPAQYQAIQLNDGSSSFTFDNNAYVLQETDSALHLTTIEKFVQSGKIINFNSQTSHISVGNKDKGTWIVFPIVNKSKKEIWSLHFGGLKDGRFSPFKEIILYNMSTKEFVVNTQNSFERNKNINGSLLLKIPTNTTNFFILYVKPNLTTPNFIKLQLTDANQIDTSNSIISWICLGLLFSGFVFTLKSAKDTHSLSDFFMSLIWLSLFLGLMIGSQFLYFTHFDIDILYPVIWIIVSQSLMIGFLSIKESRQELPVSLLGGLSSSFLIINLVGIIILKSIPFIAIYLIYVPIILIFLLIMGLTWATSLSSKREFYTDIANTSFFLFLLILSLTVLKMEILPLSPIILMTPIIVMILTVIIPMISSVPKVKASKNLIDNSIDVFEDNRIEKREISSILEAKEKSEHHRLMQVIEQERKLMSDLQVKSAQQNEDMRKAKEGADEANRAKSAFLAVVSHEIRTPMTGIMGMLSLLQDTQLSKDQKEYASTIKDSGDAMLALLNDILDFEKIESGKMDLENINFDLKRLFRSVYTLMRGHAEAKGVKLELEMDPQVPNWVYGDPTRLRQVLLNLINNGIKFTNKGSVYIRVRDLTGESQDSSNKTHQIYFAVQDSGIGIAPSSQKNLFMPFAQADTSISRKYGGTGLGLAICKRLIEAMGGAISISSKEGEGSTFFFTISMLEGSEINDGSTENMYPENSTQQKIQLKTSLSVLVVDDNGINQKVVAGFVEKLGCQSMTAGTGADALDLHARYPFDVILLDIELPDMNGIEVTKIIRNLSVPSKSNIPIIAFTGNTQSDDIKNYLNNGMNDFLGKPIAFEQITEVLSKVEQGLYSTSQSLAGTVTFFDGQENETSEELNEISPLASYTARLQDKPIETPSYQDTHFIEEDSFEMAVRQFEKMENEEKTHTTSADKTYNQLSDSGLDESILNSLKSGLSVDQIKEILISFYEKADELIAAIGNAYLEGNAIALNARAHELKGMAGNFGFSGLAKMCAIIEKAGKDNTLPVAKESVDALGEHYAIARGNLNKWLNQA